MKISLCIAVWNTSHLLRRSIHTFLRQDFPVDDWELIVIDDNSQDDVEAAIEPAWDKINMSYVRLDHDYGMRGCAVSYNTAFEMAEGEIIAETTPETLLPPNALSVMYEPHASNGRAFVAMKTHNLTIELQRAIDDVDWMSDIMAIADLPGWDHPWVQSNVDIPHFGTHQTCSIRKKVFYDITDGKGFPLFGDYGTEDPWYSGVREEKGIKDITIHDPMPIHQWHPPFTYWIAKGRAPHLNKFAHSMTNYLEDDRVPDGGSCTIWDSGSHEQLSEDEVQEWKKLDDVLVEIGVPEHIIREEEGQ
jgi:glycosyltransferase involved in cell wall biosynthesis